MSKRASGEGSIRQRPNGTWEARISYVDSATGGRKSHSVYAKTAEAVRDKLDQARDRIKEQAPVRDSSQLVADWLTHWSGTSLEASNRKESTKELCRGIVRKHLVPPPLGTMRLDRLRKTDIDGLIVELRRRGLSDATVRRVYTVLRGALDDAVLDGLVARNPCQLVRRPGAEHKEARHLDADDVSAVLKAAEGSRYRAVLVLIAATGLRRGEALGLHWQHVNLNEGWLKVRSTVRRVNDELTITEPKSERSRRTVPLSPAIVAMLKAQKAHQAAERLHAGDRWTDTGLVFTTEFGTPVEPRNLLRTIKVAAARAGVDNVGVHTLRHSAAVAWLEAGVHIKAVADLLGHSSISITGDIYGHTSDATTRAAVDGLSGALGL
ncbi:tyrosine-type recombinase/integrase [Mycobacterium paraseoulense]|uniref:Site-specific integrase n=1 Tax=Mycobacterium paraseoulense TaxID=590652 RepID=A0A1X0IA02_9MYCO|nr:site-specific integrase [Mycobacterium paraseoulense]MCV7394371.1 site-specific integrase [Mycobacterium paraseoulense]ORB40258.1 site-specific integrase [Mycobacterium paraseoulense]BBZ74137.1 site-specific integrase [Mycobacterium paraseoulense]